MTLGRFTFQGNSLARTAIIGETSLQCLRNVLRNCPACVYANVSRYKTSTKLASASDRRRPNQTVGYDIAGDVRQLVDNEQFDCHDE